MRVGSCIYTIILLVILTLANAETITVECTAAASCPAYVTSRTGAYEITAPFDLELDDWHEAHVTIEGVVKNFKYTPSYTLPKETCESYENLALLAKCGWYSVYAVIMLLIQLSLFLFATYQAYK